MPDRFGQLAQRLRSTAFALADETSPTEIHEGTATLLASVIAGDDLLWTKIDILRSHATVRRGTPSHDDAPLGAALGRYGASHPAVRSYLAPGDDRRPRRVSDLTSARAWRGSPEYCEVFRADRARFQLSVVLNLADNTGRGWVLTRSTRDFSDQDLAVATLAQPLLVALHQRQKPHRPGPAADPLTPREKHVLHLMATGMTANAIGHALGISTTTVRKHSEHIYHKLHCQDRLTAVLRAQDLGLLTNN